MTGHTAVPDDARRAPTGAGWRDPCSRGSRGSRVDRERAEPGRGLRVVMVVNNAFEWSQNFVTRELVEMVREGIDLHVYALAVQDRSDLSREERRLANRSRRLPLNPFTPGCLRRHLVHALANPARYGRALRCFLTFGHRKPRKIARSILCMSRAASTAAEIREINADLIHAHFLTAPAETALYLSTLLDIPYGVTAHAVDIFHDNSGNARKLAHASYITTCTRYNARYLESAYRMPPERIHTIHHGLSGRRKFQRTVPEGRFNFLAVGRMVEKKGYKYLVAAFAEVLSQGRDAALWFVGRGPLEDELRAQVDAMGIGDRVVFIGYVEPNRMSEVYRAAHALVVPSVVDSNGDRDGIPNVCLEAMAHTMPLVGTSISGIPEVIDDGTNGYLVAPGDAGQLATAMSRVLDPGDYVRMGLASRKLVERKFDLARNVGGLLEVMGRHAGGRACAA